MTPSTKAGCCPACFDDPHRGRCSVEWCDCLTGPVPDDPTLIEALNGYLSDEGNYVGGVWGDYGQVVVDASDISAYLTGVEHKWERTSDYAATFNQMREALDAARLNEVLLAVEEVDNAWNDEGDHIEYHDELPERLLGLRREYARLREGSAGE